MANQTLTKTINGNKLQVKNGQITYTTYDKYNTTVPAKNDASFEGILEFMYNAANNNTIGNELVVKFRKVLEEKGFMKPVGSF